MKNMIFSIEELRRVEQILKNADDGLSIDQLLINLHKKVTNYNRLNLISKVKWNPKIIISYVKTNTEVITILKIIETTTI